ncbi:MAG: pyridoxamine 5-phosphate oxidase [Gaiellaceae bacterium]|jgi:pyridoxamine 5'-phosphate oxidase|nr:pyridoxamine 5-phosphate oxidase [Gaiellaceae bacterium]
MDEHDLDPDPLRQFERWFAEARDAGLPAPEAMALATATLDGRPSARMVLLKSADERGLTFFTHYESRKGGELEANPQAALLFHWQPLGRQVRVEGRVDRIPVEESKAYFDTRPLGSRLAAWASPQSRPLTSRDDLEHLYADVETRFPGDEVPLPPHWGGVRLEPDAYEFWQHADNRLHDRVRYERGDGVWRRERLAP